MKRVNAGVIGVGTMGQHHARVYDELPGVNLVGIVDCDTEKATAIASEHDTQVMSHSALLDTADVVSIAVPTSYYHETALTCIDHGVDILIEKPVVREPDNGKLLISRSQQENVTVQVGHIERFNPAIRTVFDIIPEINIKTITARRLSSPSDRLIEDSATLDLMIHDIDIILSIVDSSIEVATAFGAQENRYTSALLRFNNGIVADLTASRISQEEVRTLSITAEECEVVVNYIDQLVEIHHHGMSDYIQASNSARCWENEAVERPVVQKGEPLKKELSAFISAATEGSEPVVPLKDGLRALELAYTIDELATDHKD